MVATNLIDPERNRLVLVRVLAFDDQHRNAVDEEDHIFPRAMPAVVHDELLRHLVPIAPIFWGSSEIAVVDQR